MVALSDKKTKGGKKSSKGKHSDKSGANKIFTINCIRDTLSTLLCLAMKESDDFLDHDDLTTDSVRANSLTDPLISMQLYPILVKLSSESKDQYIRFRATSLLWQLDYYEPNGHVMIGKGEDGVKKKKKKKS